MNKLLWGVLGIALGVPFVLTVATLTLIAWINLREIWGLI